MDWLWLRKDIFQVLTFAWVQNKQTNIGIKLLTFLHELEKQEVLFVPHQQDLDADVIFFPAVTFSSKFREDTRGGKRRRGCSSGSLWLMIEI